jgi:hypothetical protein
MGLQEAGRISQSPSVCLSSPVFLPSFLFRNVCNPVWYFL